MNRLMMCWSFAALVLMLPRALADDQKLPVLAKAVTVSHDGHGVPHIFADSWPDAYRVLGVLHVTHRLAQMEFNRRLGSGTLAEIIGPGGVEPDTLSRKLGIRRSCEALWSSTAIPAEMRAEFHAYCEGVSVAISAMPADARKALTEAFGVVPGPWQPVDCLVFMKYMGWDQSGTDDDLWLGRMAAKLGVDALHQLWPLERPYEVPAVTQQFNRKSWSPAVAYERNSKFRIDHAVGSDIELSDLWERASRSIERARLFPRWRSFGSNNWAVDGTKTKSGKPILASDPHLGFHLPSIWYACHLCVGGKSVAGVTFPGSPIVIIGHNDTCGWGITNMQADAVDYFLETVDPANPRVYSHKGEWKAMSVVQETIAVRGGQPILLEVESTVHGPIIERGAQAIAMQWTGLGMTTDPVGMWRINRAANIREFLGALDLVEVPALNIVYADIEGNIAMHPMGKFPVRLPGAGRLPMDGASGDFDWNRFVPREELPLAVNPPEHYVASANGRPYPLGYPHYLGWMWDPSYRVRRIAKMLGDAKDLNAESMGVLQNDAHDHAAERFLPAFLAAMKERPLQDPFEKEVLNALAQWDFVASREAVAPLFWQRWLDNYRDGVWQDDWEVRGIPREGGSWGFNGSNRREPVIEILEYMTREDPMSIWFDDRRTPARETRDDIVHAAFAKTVAELKSMKGARLADYAWKNFNIVSLRSLFGDPNLGRKGGAIVGDDWTVNPGGDGGQVGGGACWRMIVDFGDIAGSKGAYPGGQSGDPSSPQYADLLPLWEKGEYVPLLSVSKLEQLPQEARVNVTQFTP